MSGICGIIHFDGKPVEKTQLQHMTSLLEHWGPDDKNIWINGNVGFGHTLFRTTYESANEQQPCTLDGNVYITADARVDARDELISQLRVMGCQVAADAPDVELILHAYSIWGEACLEHLLGDFVWAIWDGNREKLICARDHFGLRTLYYAYLGNTLIFSNSIRCVQSYPDVTEELNEQAIGDWLALGDYTWLDHSITTFADIQKLPPAQMLVGTRHGIIVQRYWDIPLDTPELYYKKDEDYLEHFREVMKAAVKDRMRTDKIVVSMSGGLDSTTVAATACRLVKEESRNTQITAFTHVYDCVHPDKERYYSSLVAKKLGLPQIFFVCDDYPLLLPEVQPSEPDRFALQQAMMLEADKQLAAQGRVVLVGRSGDSVMTSSPPSTIVEMLEKKNPVLACWELLRLLRQHNILLPLGTGLRDKIRSEKIREYYPNWLNPDFAKRLGVKERWETLQSWQQKPLHPRHPELHKSIVTIEWNIPQEYYPNMGFTPSEKVDPFIDCRVVEFILSLPPLPWLSRKYLVRRAMQGELPPDVLARPKTPLGNLYNSLFAQPNLEWADNWQPHPQILNYVNRKAIPSLIDGNSKNLILDMGPILLNSWLQNRERL